MSTTDVVVVGGGPAGVATALVLTEAGRRVTLVNRPRPQKPVDVSLPPKIEPLLAILGLSEIWLTAGFVRMTGTTVFDGAEFRHHPFDPDGGRRGYQVDRRALEHGLRHRAEAAGVTWVEDRVTRVESTTVWSQAHRTWSARWVVDATGTSALFGRRAGRTREPLKTVAVTGGWRYCRVPSSFSAEDTLFEMLPDGWLWSLLRQDGLRMITLGVDPEWVVDAADLTERYIANVQQSASVGPLIETAELIAPPTVHDATKATCQRYAQTGWLITGDAASVIDPLTGHGIYKALRSGTVAASVINTLLDTPDDPIPLEYYQQENLRLYHGYHTVAGIFHRHSAYADRPFWQRRMPESNASTENLVARQARKDALMAALHPSNPRPSLRFHLHPEVRCGIRPVAQGGRIVRAPALIVPTMKEDVLLHGLDGEALLHVLRTESLTEVFDGYARRTRQPACSELGRALVRVLADLAGAQALSLA